LNTGKGLWEKEAKVSRKTFVIQGETQKGRGYKRIIVPLSSLNKTRVKTKKVRRKEEIKREKELHAEKNRAKSRKNPPH